MKHSKVVLTIFITVILSVVCFGQIKLPAIFSDNMVLQRGKPIPVWGTASPKEKIVVQFGRNRKSVTTDEKGNWRVDLPALKAGGPYMMKILGNEVVVFKNVMVGEVWLCSGQSNMAMSVEDIGDQYENLNEIAEAEKLSKIRIFTVDPNTSSIPQKDFESSGWQTCNSRQIKKFSAVAYFFGKNLHSKLNISIGLINASYGGTRVEAWTSAASLKTIPAFDNVLKSIQKYSEKDDSFLKAYNENRELWKSGSMNLDPGFPANGLRYFDTECDVSQWQMMNVPCLWYQDELKEFNGSVWYRKEIGIPESWFGKNAELNTGPIDDIDVTWFNGKEIGSNELWDKPRKYRINAENLKPGKNILTIRCIDTGGPGGVWGEANQYYLCNTAGDTIPIAGNWSYQKTLSIDKFPPRPLSFEDPNCETVLFNAMISPMIPYAIRGVIWYQGENNTYNALQYRTLFPLMINDWRNQWKSDEFPFLFVQLANYMAVQKEPAEDIWAELREAQMKTLSVRNTGMASAIDIGDSVDIHPKNKREVGKRLSLIALNKVYGRRNEFSGPIYKSSQVEGSEIRIEFDFAASGLVSKANEPLKGFAIAGADGKFVWADAKIEGNSVIVYNEQIPNPLAVRYAWASNPVCYLYNKAGLPASPFRTDDLPVLTEDFKK